MVEIVEDRTLLTAFVVTSGADSGTDTLRDVIHRANLDSSVPHTIAFDPSVTTISLTTALEAITVPVVLNSTNRTDVTIDGGGGAFDAITLGAGSDSSTVQSLHIRNFGGSGVVAQSGSDLISGNTISNVATGVKITGAAATGAVVQGNVIGILAGAPTITTTIGVLVDQAGGTFSIAGNTIGNAINAGVQILNTTAGGSITANFIGMTSSGTGEGNGDGVQIYQSSNVAVGGVGSGEGNYIGNSSGSAVVIAGTTNVAATSNSVLGNVIGFTPDPSGVPAPNNYGVSISTADGNTIGAILAPNLIDASLTSGIHLFNTTVGNTVVANLVGTRGTTAGAKNAVGIDLFSAQGNVIGGTAANLANEIVLAGTAGVVVSGTSSGNRFIGNLIGTDAGLSTTLGNPYGVLILAGDGNTIGGSNPGEPNTIGGNSSAGVSIGGGKNNFIVQNLYVGSNGVASAIPAGDINVAATANGGIQPPVIGTATISSVDPNQIDVAFASGVVGSLVEIYVVTAASRTFLLSATLGPDLKVSFPRGALNNGDKLAATASSTTLTAADPDPAISQLAGTSAFSQPRLIADDLTVTTNAINNSPGSLDYAINYANGLPGGAKITFALNGSNNVITISASTTLPSITKPITFDTSNSAPVTIQAGGAGVFDGFVLAAGSGGTSPGNGTNISNLTFAGFQGVAIRIQTDYNSVSGVALTSNKSGIEVLGSNNTITGGDYDSNVTGVTLGGTNNSITSPTFTGAGTAVRISGSNENVVGGSYTGTSTSTAILVDGSDSTITNGVFTTYATGVRVTGTRNTITGSEFHTQGTAVSLSGDSNTVSGAKFGDSTPTGNNLGVLILGSSNEVLGSTFQNYVNSGIQVVTGDDNTLAGNTFTLKNDTAVDVATAIFVGPGANQGIVPPTQFYSTIAGTSLTLNFTLPNNTAATRLQPATIEIYEDTPGSPGVLTPVKSVNANLAAGANTVVATLDAVPATGTQFLILITTQDGSTSAFSASALPNPPNVVFTTSDSDVVGSGSLRAVMNYVMSLSNSADVPIYFNIPASEMIGGFWTIFLSSPLPTVVKPIVINGWKTPGTFVDPYSGSISPLIRIMQQQGSENSEANWNYGDAAPLFFDAGAAGSEVRGLNFTGFTGPAIEINTSDVKIVGNQFYGTVGATDEIDIVPQSIGVLIEGGTNNQIGGYLPAGEAGSVPRSIDRTGNVFGWLGAGIKIEGPNTSANNAAYNSIGTNGFILFANIDGVVIQDSSDNGIQLNLIGANFETGVTIVASELGGATRNRIEGNNIGVVPSRDSQFPTQNRIGVFIAANATGNVLAAYLGSGSPQWNVIGNNTQYGVQILSANNTITGTYIGTDSFGRNLGNGKPATTNVSTFAVSAAQTAGLIVQGPLATGNMIGGTGANEANVFGWNTIGVLLDGASESGQGSDQRTVLRNNYIGTTPAGLATPNNVGLIISDSGANIIGPDPSSGQHSTLVANLLVGANFISGNGGPGIIVEGDSSKKNQIRGNLIGKGWANTGGALRTLFLGNRGSGIVITGGSDNVIGGASAGVLASSAPISVGIANLITGNFDGIDVAGGSNLYIGGNQVAQNLLNGIVISGDLSGSTTVARIVGNIIGMNFAGTSNRSTTTSAANTEPTGNGLSGILIDANSDSTARSGAAKAVRVIANLISSNGLDGVKVGDAGYEGGRYANVAITGNVIGLNIQGAPAAGQGQSFGNVLDGVGVWNTGGVVVGKESAADLANRSNIISGNLGRGVAVYWLASPADQGYSTRIASNYIGTNLTGTLTTVAGGLLTGNLSDGVFIFGQAWVNVESNVIAGNRAAGVHAFNPRSSFEGRIWISSNFIGANPNVGAPNDDAHDFGNGSDGVFLDSILAGGFIAPGDARSKGVAIEGNKIGANDSNGVQILNSTSINITDNKIGDVGQINSPNGQPPANGNGSHGVFLNKSSNIQVGGGDGSWNTISGNRGDGIMILGNYMDHYWSGNTIAGNRIGLDASGSTPVGNLSSGIVVVTSSNNQIGTPPSGPSAPLTPQNVISGNGLYGVLIVGQNVGGSYNNTITRNYIGATQDGLSGAPNSADGVFLLNALSTMVGGWTRAEGNIISGNQGQGVRVFGPSAGGNTIGSNVIGLNKNGAALGNAANGVILDQVSASAPGGGNRILGNTISGNGQSGVMVTSTSRAGTGVQILGNVIGLTPAGNLPAPNDGYGILVFGASQVQVGSAQAGLGNTISGNNLDGVLIYSPSSNAPARLNTVVGNFIGTDPSGTQAAPNQGTGVHIINGFNNQIGQDGASRNVISGNNGSGILLEAVQGYTAYDMSPNRISGNFIGVDATGIKGVGNQLYGVEVVNAAGTLIGSPNGSASVVANTFVPAAGSVSNVISGNVQAGIYLTGTTSGTRVLGNYLGVGADGRAYDASGVPRNLYSAQASVLIDDNAHQNLIGGWAPSQDSKDVVPGTGNIITQNWAAAPSANSTLAGILINSPFAADNVISANLIGLDANGRSGGNKVGVLLSNGVRTTIGGLTGGQRAGDGVGPYSSFGNVISGNSEAGVEITGSLAQDDRIYGNYIGPDATGTIQPAPRTEPTTNQLYRPSQLNGVLILQGSGHIIGAAYDGKNLISGNGAGVSVATLQSSSSSPSNIVIEGNTIGTDRTGMVALPNYEFGVLLTSAGGNSIRYNQISANGVAGVEIVGAQTQAGGTGGSSLQNTITSNNIGLDAAGQVAFSVSNGTQTISSIKDHPAITLPDGLVINLGFQSNGVVIIGASDNQVLSNTISGNIQVGVYISRIDNLINTYGVPTGNLVRGNDLGLNGIYGVLRYDAPNNSVDSNTFTGTPIPISDFNTSLDSSTSSNYATSILLGNSGGTTTQTNRTRVGTTRTRPTTLSRPRMAQAARALQNG